MFGQARRSTKTPLAVALLAVATRFALRAKMSAHAFALVLALALSFAACSGPAGDNPPPASRVGSVSHALTDTDGDGLDDDWEMLHFGGLSQTASGDTSDSDGMTNLEEYTHGFDPNVKDAFDDADGDRYPNIFELRNGGSNPNSAASLPLPTFKVDGAGGGTHLTVAAAIAAADVPGNAYPIVGIAPGVDTGVGNLNLYVQSQSSKKLLIIGLEGAAKTIFEDGAGWSIYSTAIVSSLTFRRLSDWGLRASLPLNGAGELRLIDILMRDGTSTGYAVGVQVSAPKTYIIGSTFLKRGPVSFEQIYIAGGEATMRNTVVWSSSEGTTLLTGFGASLTTSHCLVKGQDLGGTGDLPGTTDPKLRTDGRLLWDSPLRAAGGSGSHSRLDMDLEERPANSVDIGVDQLVDLDGDGLADAWEREHAEDLDTLTSDALDNDGDGLSNGLEYVYGVHPLLADSDGDGLSDGDEVDVHGTSPSKLDTDGDDMPDGWELANGLLPRVKDGFEDKDGDRYPNVFEHAYGTDPATAASVPLPTFVVNGAGGGTHPTVSAAVNAANVAGGAYQIIGIAPGVYKGDANLSSVQLDVSKPKLLIIGLEGAARTTVDGGGRRVGWGVVKTAVIASLTFQRVLTALRVTSPTTSSPTELYAVDLRMKDNPLMPGSIAASIQANVNPTAVHVVGCTFLDNTGAARQIYVGAGAVSLRNTVVWAQGIGTMLTAAGGATLTADHSLVKGMDLSGMGSGNLAGSVDPLLRTDGRLRSTSPLRGAGVGGAESRVDMDKEPRPTTGPDIGVDQYLDDDDDGLPDAWEVSKFGTTAVTTGSEDSDIDGLTNLAEYVTETDPIDADTDDDGVMDGLELVYGLNPFLSDSDELVTDWNLDRIFDALDAQLGYSPNLLDNDGDSITNADELLAGTNPFRPDTDGDGVPDNVDVFPHDPAMSSLPSNPLDATPPIIMLTAPSYAVEQP